VKIFPNLRNSWTAIKWKILLIFSFFSIVSVIMATGLSIAVLNVLIRRESAYLIEERIKVIVESRKGLVKPVLDRVQGCQDASSSALLIVFAERLNAEWPGSQSVVSVLPPGGIHAADPVCLMRLLSPALSKIEAVLISASSAQSNGRDVP
jgi:hypothetical protein